MTDPANPAPTQRTAIEIMERAGKAIPALAAMVVILSLIFETLLLFPIGVGFLSYYSWQDFLRNAVVWIPALVPIVGYPVLFSVQLKVVGELHAETRKLRAQIVKLGGTIPKKNYLWGVVRADLKNVRFWIFVLCLIAGTYESLYDGLFLPAMLLWVFGLFIWTIDGSASSDALSAEVVSTIGQTRSLIAAFLFASVVAAFWGSYVGRAALRLPEDSMVQLRGDRPEAPKTMQCNVLRELNSVLLAVCGGKLHAINNAFVEFVKYDAPKPVSK